MVEDAAQAFGALRARATLGRVATFSFFPTKNLPGLGDGGLVATDDDALAERVRLLRFHGSRDKQTFEAVGYNSRLDELQAAALRLFLTRLDAWNAARREAAARYAELGLGEACELPVDEPGHVYHLYVVRTQERETLATALGEAGIACAAYYRHRSICSRCSARSATRRARFPETERAARENLALPLWAGYLGRPAGAGRRARARCDGGRSRAMKLISRHRIWQVVVDAGLLAAAWYLAFWLRFDTGIPVFYERLWSRSFSVVSRSGSPSSRSSASTTTGGATCRSRTCGRSCAASRSRASSRSSPSASINPVPGIRVPRSVLVLDWLILLALVAGPACSRERSSSGRGPRRTRGARAEA